MSSDLELLNSAYDGFVDGFIQELREEHPDLPEYLHTRLRRMINYSCKGGKCFRAIQVIMNARNASLVTNVDFATIQHKTLALAWAVEVLQAAFLVADDFMDSSITRRGNPCWYRLDDVGTEAINDTLVLESFMHYLIEQGTDDSNYRQIVKLYLQTCKQTQMGQTLDLLSMPQGRKSLEILRTFNLTLYKNIVKYKTAFYTFYLPMAAGLVLGGIRDLKTLKACEEICMEIGEKFQIQDDYLDNYGDPAHIGKIGTDIQDHKCSWLCVQALENMNDEQRARFELNYGHDDPEKIAEVKKIFDELDLKSIYNKQEEDSLKRINDLISKHSDIVKAEWFEVILKKVHNRQK